MNQECFAGFHARFWVPFGAVATLLVAAIPASSLGVLLAHRTRLGDMLTVQVYGFMYMRYK